MSPEQTSKVLEALERLLSRQDELLELMQKILEADDGQLYLVDMFAIGAAKRTLSLVAGLDLLVRNWNMVCARALLRMQIDTALRFGALTLVENRDQFVNDVLAGQRIDKLKDRQGHRLTDAHLVEVFKTKAPWLPNVYDQTSGYVHLSGHHMFASVQSLSNDDRTVTWSIGSEDDKFPESSWIELVDCFEASVGMFVGLLNGWSGYKAGLSSPSPDAG